MKDIKEVGQSLNFGQGKFAEGPSCGNAFLTSVLLPYHCLTHNEDSAMIQGNKNAVEDAKSNEMEASHLHLTDSVKEGRVVQNSQHDFSKKQDQASVKILDSYVNRMSHCLAKPYKCQSCNWSFKRKYSLSQHMEHYHSENSPRLKRSQPVRMGKTVCEICGKMIKRFSQLQIHLRSHTGEKAFFCDICNRGFNVACNYRRHLLRHGKQNFECSYCKKQYFEKRHLDIHISKMHSVTPKHKENKGASPLVEEVFSEDNKKFSCQYCSKRYLVKESLTHHLQHNHIPCKECDKICQNRSEHKIHQLVHTSYRPFFCKVCGKNFKCKASLDRHMICHTDYMSYSCDICQKKFRQPQGLWRHKKYHQTEKPHVCSVCSKAFCHKADLKRHSKIHKPKTQAHPHHSSSCQPTLISDGYLSAVGQIKTWMCIKCMNQFSGSSELERHVCKAVSKNDTALLTIAVETSGGDSATRQSSDVSTESERVIKPEYTKQDCKLLLEQCSNLDVSITGSETKSTTQSVNVGIVETASEAHNAGNPSHHISVPDLGLGEANQTEFEQTLLLNSNTRIKDLVLSVNSDSKMMISQPTAAETSCILQLQESSPNNVLIESEVQCELKPEAMPSSSHLVYVILQPTMDNLVNCEDVSINESITRGVMDSCMTGCLSEQSSPVDVGERLVRSSSDVIVKKQTIQYGQSLLTGKKVPLIQNSETFMSSVTHPNLEHIQNITLMPPDNLLSEAEDDKVDK